MARKASVGNEDLLARLGATFRRVGYDGASLAQLSEATGLKKASLYHRFPDGKEQMGLEVLQEAGRWLTRHVLEPLAGEGSPRERITAMASELDVFYQNGKQACLLNLLSSPIGIAGPFQTAIRDMLEAFVAALAAVAEEAGFTPTEARERAERLVALVQGGLVLARGLGSTDPFTRVLSRLPTELLGTDTAIA